jgi:TIR domain
MAEAIIGKRPFHAFLSHAHVDKEKTDSLYHFLYDVANIPVWYDAVNLPPGATIAGSLFEAIENSRAAIILLSQQSVTRGWVQQEYRAAINHQTNYPDFRIIPLRLDDVDPPDFLQNYSNLLIKSDALDSRTAAHILKALYQPTRTTMTPADGRHTYISRGWHPTDFDLYEGVSRALSRTGLRLVGDAPDQPSWVEERISRILDSCGAFVAVLPYRSTAPHKTSKYVLREWELAISHDLPCLVIPHQDVDLPKEMLERPGLVTPSEDTELLLDYAVNLSEEWRTPHREPYVFYATDFGLEGRELRTLAKESIEAVTGLSCRIGEYVEDTPVQSSILRMVTNASVLLADISGDSPNVYVEIGAARGAGVPVALLRRGLPGRPAFMLRDQQVYDYTTDAESVARAIRVSYPYRRFLQT